MKMSVSSAFNRTACGTISSQTAYEYDNFMRDYYASLQARGGWISEVVTQVLDEHMHFMNSRMWEFGRLGRADIGNFVGQYEIGYLRTLNAQQRAKGYMCSVIMAHPQVAEYYAAGRIDGFSDETLHQFCTGQGEDNYFYRKVTDGTLTMTKDAIPSHYKRFISTRDKLTTLSENEREDALRTWRATSYYLEAGYDPTSAKQERVKTPEEAILNRTPALSDTIH